MAAIKDILRQLIKLQEHDRALATLEASIEEIPVRIRDLQERLESEKTRLADAKSQSTRLQLSKREKELSLRQKEEAIRKHNTELNQVKTNEAYKALQVEIDKAKSEVSDLETDILTIMEELDHASREEKSVVAALKEIEAKTQAEIRVLETKKAGLTTQASADHAKRDALAAEIPAETIKLYDHIRKRKQGSALSAVNGNMCGVCRITLMPQSLVDLARGTRFVTCEACQRIIYNPELVAETPAETAPAAKTEAAQ